MSMTHGLRSESGITAQQAMAAAAAVANSQERVKQPMNAYILWCCDRRPQLAKEHPRMKPRDISRRMGEEWKLLTKTEKASFLKEAERLKAVLLKEHPDYRMRKTKKDKKLADKRQADGQEDEEQQHIHNDEQQQKDQLPSGEQQHLGGEEEHLPNVDGFSEMTSSNSSSSAEDAELKIPGNEKQLLIDEQEQQQLLPSNEQEEQLLPSNEQEEQLLPSNEQEQQQVLKSNDQELLSDVEVEVPYDGQQEEQLQVPDVEQELVPNKVSGMLTVTSSSSSVQVDDCQQQVAENVAQHQAAVSPSFEPEPELQHLAEALPSHHTSAFSVPAARRGFMYTQYGQVASQQQLGYPGWGYPVSHPPQNLHAASTNTGYHHLSYYTAATVYLFLAVSVGPGYLT